MCSRRACLCCSVVPVSVVVALVAVLLPQSMTKDACEKDARGICKRVQGGEPAVCQAGVFVELAKQSTLGLRHVVVEEGAVPFASVITGECSATFSLTCGAGGVDVQESSTCNAAATETTSLGDSWEVCAKGAQLNLLLPVIDLTYDIEIAAGRLVEGCVRVSAPRRLPYLSAVRGSLEEQRDSLVAKKAEVGGCPTWASDEDRVARAEDFAAEFNPVLVLFVREHMKRAKTLTVKAKAGQFLDAPDGWGLFLFAGTVAACGGVPGAAAVAPLLFCGAPAPAALPSVNAIQVSRHADLVKLISDPEQKRLHQIGGGSSEVCFEPTLPVFLSTGEPPHIQTRKLWDAVGLKTMHLVDIPDVTPPPESTFFKLRKAAMGAVGMTAPLMDELALYVAPLFLEALWGKKPSAEETAAIAAYASVGGPCIMSQVVEKLPIVPSKILAVRAAARAFARESPVGKKMAEEINKPEYAELKAMYASRPMGVVDGALGALTDASLFAGLIGTSTMTMNAMMQLHRGPQFVKMFRQNSTAFMLEVMRTASAVAGSLQATRSPWKLTMLSDDVEYPSGKLIMQLTGLAGGLDASVFPDPTKFDTSRPNLGETMNFNGLSKYVLTQNYTGAPRYCPGANVAIKIASKVVEYLTKDMEEA